MTAATQVAALSWVRLRMCVFGALMGCLFLGVGYRAYHLQVRERPRLRAMAEEQYLKEIEVGVHRGTIYDRHRTELAQSIEVDSVYANPRQLRGDLRETARRLGRILKLAPGEVLARLTPRRYFSWIKRRVTPAEARAVRELGLVGVGLTSERRRFYPNSELGGPLLGFAGIDGRGLEGIELGFDQYLRGDRRTVAGLRDALGRELLTGGVPETAPTAGRDVELTIDKLIQFVAERALDEAVVHHRARAGTIVVLDPQNGEILALASRPTYDPNRPEHAARLGARNRALTDPFEPGSTMKVFSVAAALDAGVVRPTESWNCEGGRFRIGQYTIHDAHPHGVLSTAEVLQKSSNIGAAKIARRLGRERLHQQLGRFGFGRPTGVGLPGERGGQLRPAARWGEIGLATVAFGQGLTATPLQLVSALASIGNGGMLYAPTIVRRVTDASGRHLTPPRPAPRRVLKAESAQSLIEMLKLVTLKGGTATAAAIPGFAVAGKTGTAQKVNPATGHYSKDKMVSSFMGLVPADRPRLAMIVIIDEPQGERYGGTVAGPVFRRVGEEALRYLGVTANPTLTVAAERAAGAAIEGSPGVAEVAPERESVPTVPVVEPEEATDETAGATGADRGPLAAANDPPGPLAGEVPASHPSAEEAEDEVELVEVGDEAVAGPSALVPDFSGMSIAEALAAARARGLELEIIGSGRAIGQSRRGGRAAPGARVRVSFAPR